jgi:hypothetical protein
MKPPVIFVILLVAAGGIFYYGEYYNKKPVAVAAPPPAAPAAPVVVIPNLKVIPVKNGLTIKNAQVKMINSDGIIFICDRGMVQASFDDLPPEFKDYYASKADPNYAPAQPTPVQSVSYQQSQGQSYSGPTSQETEAQREQARAYTAERIAVVKSHIENDQSIIDRYMSQSAAEDPRHPNLTNSDYEFAKANLEQNQSELQQLQSQPQN